MAAKFRSPFPHTEGLTGHRRQRLDDQRPHPRRQYRFEKDFYRVAESHNAFVGGYWTGESVDHHDLAPLEEAQLRKKGLGLCLGDQIALLDGGRWVAGFVGIIGDPYDAWSTMLSAPTVDFYQSGDPEPKPFPKNHTARGHVPSSLQTTQVIKSKPGSE